MSVGMPAHIKLELFGRMINETFGEHPYHVGSSLNSKTGWRDVDVRLILDDEEWDRLGFGTPSDPNRKWSVYCLAFSLLGRDITGLPIDFQIQQQTHANEKHNKGRSCLGILHRTTKEPT